ncbi:MAG: hypothetical protein ACM3YM_02835 [Sphingomonadales bacterium]
MADLDPAVELVAQAIREATDTELDDCLEDADECFERRIHLASSSNGVIQTVYATPEQIGRVSVAALASAGYVLLPPGGEAREVKALVADLADQLRAAKENLTILEGIRDRKNAEIEQLRSALASIERASGRTWQDAIEALRDRERTAKYGVHRAVAKQAADYLTATEGRG